MATRHEVAEYPAPRFGDLPPAEDWLVRYDDSSDTLNIHFGPPRAAVSFDVGDHVWLRSDPATGDVVGIEVEDFREAFLAENAEFGDPMASFDRPSSAWGWSFVSWVRSRAAANTQGALHLALRSEGDMTNDMHKELLPLGFKPERDPNGPNIYDFYHGGECQPLTPCDECIRTMGEWLNDDEFVNRAGKLLEWFRALNEISIQRVDDGVFMTSLLGPRTRSWFEAVSYELTIMIDKVMGLGVEVPQTYEPHGSPIEHRVEELAREGRVDFLKQDRESGTLTPDTEEGLREDLIARLDTKRRERETGPDAPSPTDADQSGGG